MPRELYLTVEEAEMRIRLATQRVSKFLRDFNKTYPDSSAGAVESEFVFSTPHYIAQACATVIADSSVIVAQTAKEDEGRVDLKTGLKRMRALIDERWVPGRGEAFRMKRKDLKQNEPKPTRKQSPRYKNQD